METVERVKQIVENIACRKLTDKDLDSSWIDLSLDSLSLVELLRDVEDEFKLELDYDIFTKENVTTINSLSAYLSSK